MKMSGDDIIECIRIGKNVGDRPRRILLSLRNLSIKQKIYNKKRCTRAPDSHGTEPHRKKVHGSCHCQSSRTTGKLL